MGAPIHGNIEATKTTDTVKGSPDLGDVMWVGNKAFIYCFSGAAIGAGAVIMSPAAPVDHDMDLVVAAAAVDAKELSVTIGVTSSSQNITADQFSEIYINDGAGEGHLYEIANHVSVDVSAVTTLALTLKEKVREATVAATSLAGLIPNKYQDVVTYNVTTPTGAAIGVAPAEIADDEYFWAQVSGLASVLVSAGGADEAVATPGTTVRVSSSNGANGSVTLGKNVGSTGHDLDYQPIIGTFAGIAVVTTDSGLVKLSML
jgi:hypothetical protein